jgi:hypothetical protein
VPQTLTVLALQEQTRLSTARNNDFYPCTPDNHQFPKLGNTFGNHVKLDSSKTRKMYMICAAYLTTFSPCSRESVSLDYGSKQLDLRQDNTPLLPLATSPLQVDGWLLDQAGCSMNAGGGSTAPQHARIFGS